MPVSRMKTGPYFRLRRKDNCIIEGNEDFATITNGDVKATIEAGFPWYGGIICFYRKDKLILKTINEQIQNIAQKKDTLCRRMYN